jgi:hypothetical protein
MGFILDGLESEAYGLQPATANAASRSATSGRTANAWLCSRITLNSLAASGGPILISAGIDLMARNPSIAAIALLALGVRLAWWRDLQLHPAVVSAWWARGVKIREDVSATMRRHVVL